MANRVQSAAGTVCLINGQVFGIVTGLSYQLGSPRTEYRGLDSLVPFELGISSVSVSGTIQVLMLRENEGLEGRGITAGLRFVEQEPYFTMELQDRASGFSIMKIDDASMEVQGWQFAAKSLVSGSFTFKGITAKTHMNQ